MTSILHDTHSDKEVNEWHSCAEAEEAKEEDVKTTERDGGKEGGMDDEAVGDDTWHVTSDTFSGDKSKTGGEARREFVWKQGGSEGGGGLTYAHIFIVQFCRGIAVVSQLA